MNNIEQRVIAVLSEQLEMSPERIHLDMSISDDLGADSLDIVEIVMTLEEEFDRNITDETAEQLVTVDDVVQMINSMIAP